ncbi:MAG: TetR/AcrR family transcriptional regulator [Salinisphaeraceae bacterium]|nr:TetR/AcrR family transcriptional regulator [Salinisphaeraceae bacterium]
MSAAAAIAEDKVTPPVRRRAERLAVAERRKQLLELGVKTVGARRYEEPWLEEVARTADISKGLIYHYFDTKRGYYVEILRYIAQDLAQSWQESVSPLIAGSASADEVTTAGLNSYLDFAQQYPAAFRTLMEAGGSIDPEVKQVEGFLRDELITHITRFAGQDDLPELMKAGIRAWAAFVEQLSVEWLESKNINRDEVIKMACAMMQSMVASQR